MSSKTIILGHVFIVLIMMQVAVGQTSDVLNNSTNITVGTPVSVLVGPIGVTNACLITTVQDADDLRREIDVEINKVKSDLRLQNQRTMDSVRDECDQKYHDALMRISADAENWFGKMKGALDESRATISDMIDGIGIIVAIVTGFLTIVVGVFGIVLPMLKERKRNLEFTAATKRLAEETEAYGKLNGALKQWMVNYDDLKRGLEKQRADYDRLLGELQEQKRMQADQFNKLQDAMNILTRKSERDVQWLKGKDEYDSAENDMSEYNRDETKTWRAVYVLESYSLALYHFKLINDVGWMRLVIWSMHNAVTTSVWIKNVDKIRDGLKDWTWDVALADVLGVLASKEDDGRDYAGWFKEIYAKYGKPKT